MSGKRPHDTGKKKDVAKSLSEKQKRTKAWQRKKQK